MEEEFLQQKTVCFVPRILHPPPFNAHLFDQSASLHTLGCTPLLRTCLLTVVNTYQPPRCPSVDEWIKPQWYVYMMESYWAVKKKETLPFTTAWMNVENIMLVK